MDKERYVQYLDALDRLLADWGRYRQTISAAMIANNRDDCHKVCHVMFLSIQTAIDLSHLIIAEKGFIRPSSNKECFEILQSEHFLSESDLVKSLKNLASFRNVLAHQYPKLNPRLAHRNLEDGFSVLKSYARIVARRLLRKQR